MAAEGDNPGLAEDAPLYLIDGPSLVYRAFYAIQEDLRTADGRPTNAIYGFALMLVKLLAEQGRLRGVVAWDRGSSGRADLYEPYKATRRARPPELAEQWEAAEQLAQAIGFLNVALDGYEADDVIATLARRAREAKPPLEVVVVTGDRDALQLVDRQGLVRVLATARGVTDTKLYDYQAVVDRFGVPPQLIPDLYGLKGDSSDNIPGVPGIGEKTAAQLLSRFGSLEGVLEHVEEVGGAKRKEALRAHADQALLSKELASAHDNLPLEVDPRQLPPLEPDLDRLRPVFAAHELRTPLRRLEEALAARGAASNAKQPAERPAKRTAAHERIDLAGLSRLPACEWALAVRPPAQQQLFEEEQQGWEFALAQLSGSKRYAGAASGPAEVVEALGERPLCVHAAKELGRVPDNLAHDTMLGAYLIEPARRSYPLAELCAQEGIELDDDGVVGQAVGTAQLTARQRQRLQQLELTEVLEQIELPLVAILRAMEVVGVRLDVAALEAVAAKVRAELVELEAQIHQLAGEEFLISSPQQLARILFEKLGLPRRRRGKTGYSTDARVLQAIREHHPIVPLIERYRELSTLVKTYLDVLPKLVDQDSRLHTTFLQTVAQTGRLSSTNPNLQNVPVRSELGREIRRCFCAAEGWLLIAADYSQIELRVLAHAAKEPALVEIFSRGEDVHTATAAQVFGVDPAEVDGRMRSKAKMVNYGIVYGLSDFGLADRLNIPLEEAHEFIEAYLDRFPQVARFMRETVERARREGYVRTLYGRRRPTPELTAANPQLRAAGERVAINAVVQGTAADIIKLAMVGCARALARERLATRLILTIHDELLFEAPPAEEQRARELIEREMVAVWPHEPKLVVEIGSGRNWLEAK